MTEQEIKQRFQDALNRLDGDIELLCEMAAITAPDCPEVIGQIENAFDSEDCEAGARGLHKLKGMLSTFESDGVVIEMQELLELARKNKLEELRRAYGQCRQAILRCVANINELAGAGPVIDK